MINERGNDIHKISYVIQESRLIINSMHAGKIVFKMPVSYLMHEWGQLSCDRNHVDDDVNKIGTEYRKYISCSNNHSRFRDLLAYE